MLRKIYDWAMKKSAGRRAELWLALIVLLPADFLFVPMALARPRRAYRYALIATLASTVGAIIGYYFGLFAYDELAKPILALYGKLDAFEQLRASTTRDAILPVLISSGIAHFPPIEIATILSGAIGVDIWLFAITCVLSRGVRFFVLAWAFATYGESIRGFIERRLELLAGAAALLVIVVYFVANYAT
jgi:membrane protein YqaA with SNARE-associated domain